MKKVLIPALLLTLGTAMAGQPVMITCAAPQPVQNKACPVTLEFAGVYAFANRSLFSQGDSEKIDVYGGDVTAVHKIDGKHSVNLRLGYTFGDEGSERFGTKHETDLHSFYLMPGYRYTHAINDKTSLYMGVNIGVANLSVKDHERGPWGRASQHDSAYGFSYSAEIGLRHWVSERCELFAAYEFAGSTANPGLDYRDGGRSARNQTYNALRAGVSVLF